ncbi:QueT transporter family protein [Clostridium sp.]|uniref:QueT transporter family protein n=1 Tax=Clostridium sp. TaxID=1506 RepID=UPI0034639E61
MKNSKFLKILVLNSLIAALYAVLTIFVPFSYGAVQFRISEILTLLAFINRKYIPGLILGCFIGNLGSALGPLDIILGTLATAIAVTLMSFTKNLFVSTLWPVIVNALIIGGELYYVLNLPFIASAFSVAFGEFVVVSIAGYFIFKSLLKNEKLMDILKL